MSRFPKERINLIILGTYCACSGAILVIQSYNGDLWKMNRGHCREASLFSDKVVKNYFKFVPVKGPNIRDTLWVHTPGMSHFCHMVEP